MNATDLPVRTKLAVTGAAVAVLAAGVAGYIGFVQEREQRAEQVAATSTGLPETINGDPTGLNQPIFAINRSPGDLYRAITRIDPDGSVTRVGDARCDALAFGGGKLACLSASGPNAALTFIDPVTGSPEGEQGVPGIPSRTQVSVDGVWASSTTFVEGHSYAVPGEFSTYPVVVHTPSGNAFPVEDFQLFDENGGEVFAIDRNYWGMAFDPQDPTRFYAAVQWDKNTYIVQGNTADGTARVILPGFGCPTPSPDGTRLIVRDEHSLKFLLHDLSTGTTTSLDEDRVSDDQARWIDDHTIIYSLPADNPGSAARPAMDLWALNVDSGERHLVARAASSASV